MRHSVIASIAAFALLFLLHHDFWNWDSTELVFGFIPIGLAYHAGYSLAVSAFWILVIRYAWPHSIERWADEPQE